MRLNKRVYTRFHKRNNTFLNKLKIKFNPFNPIHDKFLYILKFLPFLINFISIYTTKKKRNNLN